MADVDKEPDAGGDADGGSPRVRTVMVEKIEKICKAYVDHLEAGGDPVNFQNILIMYILGACNNSEYRDKLFTNWPTVSGGDSSTGTFK